VNSYEAQERRRESVRVASEVTMVLINNSLITSDEKAKTVVVDLAEAIDAFVTEETNTEVFGKIFSKVSPEDIAAAFMKHFTGRRDR